MLEPLTKQKKCQIDQVNKTDKADNVKKADKANKVDRNHKPDEEVYEVNNKLNSSASLSIFSQ